MENLGQKLICHSKTMITMHKSLNVLELGDPDVICYEYHNTKANKCVLAAIQLYETKRISGLP